MAVKAENRRAAVTMDGLDQKLYELECVRAKADYQPDPSMTDFYRMGIRAARYADWTRKSIEAMDVRELALFVATYDMGIGCGSDDNGVFAESTAAVDEKALEKAVARLHELTDASRW